MATQYDLIIGSYNAVGIYILEICTNSDVTWSCYEAVFVLRNSSALFRSVDTIGILALHF